MAVDPFTIFFTGKDDPRENLIVIGTTTHAIFYRFETPEAFASLMTRTTVYRNNNEVVARFDWDLGMHLGTGHYLGKDISMSQLVMKGTNHRCRRFTSRGGGVYEWRSCLDNPHGYDLHTIPGDVRIAEYRRMPMSTPVGPSHALLHLWFDSEPLLLEALLSLCLNRWLDWQGL